MKHLALIAFACMPIFISVPTMAQAVGKAAPSFSNWPFNPALTKLSPGSKGNDLERIFKVLNSRQVKKGEFESMETYTRRRTKIMQKPLYGQLKSDSTLAFVIKPNPKVNEAAYSVEKQLMSVICPTTHIGKDLVIDPHIQYSTEQMTANGPWPETVTNYYIVPDYGPVMETIPTSQ
jgi:hypothetical protein